MAAKNALLAIIGTVDHHIHADGDVYDPYRC